MWNLQTYIELRIQFAVKNLRNGSASWQRSSSKTCIALCSYIRDPSIMLHYVFVAYWVSSTLQSPKLKRQHWKNKLRLQQPSFDYGGGSYRWFENSSTASHQSRLILSQRGRRACRSDTLIWLTGNGSLWSGAATGHSCLYPPIRCQNNSTFFNSSSTNWKARRLWSIFVFAKNATWEDSQRKHYPGWWYAATAVFNLWDGDGSLLHRAGSWFIASGLTQVASFCMNSVLIQPAQPACFCWQMLHANNKQFASYLFFTNRKKKQLYLHSFSWPA